MCLCCPCCARPLPPCLAACVCVCDQAFAAEHHCEAGGEIIMSPQAWALVKDFFEAKEILHGGFARIGVRLPPALRVVFVLLASARMSAHGEPGVGSE